MKSCKGVITRFLLKVVDSTASERVLINPGPRFLGCGCKRLFNADERRMTRQSESALLIKITIFNP